MIIYRVIIMIKRIFSIVLLLGNISISSAKVWDAQGHPIPEVREISSYFPQVDPLIDFSNLSQLDEYAQKYFLRPKGSERLDEKAIHHYKKLCNGLSTAAKEKLLTLFNKLGYVEAIYPKNKTPDYICIQGSTVPTMRERLMFLAKLVEEEKIILTDKTKIVALVGERPLFKSETTAVLLDPSPWQIDPMWQAPEVLPTDEREAALFIWQQLKLPKALRERSILFVDAKKKQGESRAQTVDSTQTWLETEQVEGDILMISSNPYISYQEAVMNYAIKKAGLHQQVHVEGTGCGTKSIKDIDVELGILLDTLAREIHMEKEKKQII